MSIAQMSLIGGVMILAVLIFRALGADKLPKRGIILLWEIVLLRLLLPVSIPLPILPAVTNPPPVQAAVPQGLPAQNTVQPSANPGADSGYISKNEANTAPSLPEHKAETNQPDRDSTPGSSRIPLKTVYLIGAAAVAGFFALSYVYSMHKFSGGEEAENEYIVGWLRNHKSARRISVRLSDTAVSPMTYGVFRPVILLPRSTDFSDCTRLDYILEHEYAHIRHFDALKKLIAAAALSLHWFNPLVWLMNMLYNRDIELWCDECVIAKFGRESRSGYARVLIAMEELKIGALPISGFCRSPVKERITSIMKFKKKTLAALICAALLTVTATATIAATSLNPVPKKSESPSEPQSADKGAEDDSTLVPQVKRELIIDGKTYDYDEPIPWNQMRTRHDSETGNGTTHPILPEDSAPKKKIYDSFEKIYSCRRDGEDIEDTGHGIPFEKGERAEIVFEFDHELTEAEKALDVVADAYVLYDDGFYGHAVMNDDGVYVPDEDSWQHLLLTSKEISGNTIAFRFEAPASACYSFWYLNCAPKWLYATDFYVEMESAAAPGKFGSRAAEDFKAEYTVYSDEEFEEYTNRKLHESGHTQTVTDIKFLGRTYAIEDDIKYIQPGEPFRDGWETKGEDERFARTVGALGLTFTVDNCTIYDSWKDSGIPQEDIHFTSHSPDEYTILKFIVLDCTAAYNKTSPDSADMVQGVLSWTPVIRKNGEDSVPYYSCYGNYFSAGPKPGDILFHTGEPLDPESQFRMFGKPIKDGESIKFQYAIFAEDSAIEEKTIYLRDRSYRQSEQEDKLQYYNILGNK